MTQKTFKKVAGYVGIYTRESQYKTRTGKVKPDLSFYARGVIDGKSRNIFLGRSSEKMTAALAAEARVKLIAGMPIKLPTPRKGKRGKAAGSKDATGTGKDGAAADDYLQKIDPQEEQQPADHWILTRLWEKYVKHRGGPPDYWSAYKTDRAYFENHIIPLAGHLRPADITPLAVGQIRNSLTRKKTTLPGTSAALKAARAARAKALLQVRRARGPIKKTQHQKAADLAADRIAEIKDRIKANQRPLSPATIEKCIELIRRLCNFGADNELCPGPARRIQLKTVHNERTEDLTAEQIAALLKACDESPNQTAADMIRLALGTGLRRGSLFKLAWQHINFDKKVIIVKSIEHTGRHSKGGHQIKIPMSDEVIRILKAREKVADKKSSPYVFPGKKGALRVGETRAVRRIVKAAGLPDDFRPLHGLRHAFASNLANTGLVDLHQIGALLAHSPNSPTMTKRYSHLRDDALNRAANIMGDIISRARTQQGDQDGEEEKAKILPFAGNK
jgi:integrase